jgi:hypothetical protein
MAREAMRYLLATGIAPERVAESYTITAVKLVLEHAGREAAQDLLTSLFMMVHQHEETPSHGHAST